MSLHLPIIIKQEYTIREFEIRIKKLDLSLIKYEKFDPEIIKLSSQPQETKRESIRLSQELTQSSQQSIHAPKQPVNSPQNTTHVKQEPAVDFELQLPQQKPPNPPNFKCKKFNNSLKSPKHLKHHTCTFTCKTCSKSFLRRDNLTQHMTFVHGKWNQNDLFTCDHCNKFFKYRKSLVCHMKQHMEVKPLVCSICNEGFSVTNTYKQHMLTHGAKVSCKVCGKMLMPSAIYYHMKQSHETERKFKCGTCGAAFKTTSDLSSHVKCHDKRFDCKVCGRKFSKAFKLRQHLQVHSDPDAFKCKKCSKRYTRKDGLDLHLRNVHGKD
jgi:hypothetical protein